ncbi:MAG: AbrB/MazE/SpoVT family DNA-binding domain-containing protein [Bryobacteraceae bacterium]
MSTTVTLDKAGRVVIPKALRDEIHLDAGDELELLAEGETLTLRPVRAATRLRKKQGIWVFGGGERVTAAETDAVLRSIREQRDRRNRGDDR